MCSACTSILFVVWLILSANEEEILRPFLPVLVQEFDLPLRFVYKNTMIVIASSVDKTLWLSAVLGKTRKRWSVCRPNTTVSPCTCGTTDFDYILTSFHAFLLSAGQLHSVFPMLSGQSGWPKENIWVLKVIKIFFSQPPIKKMCSSLLLFRSSPPFFNCFFSSRLCHKFSFMHKYFSEV